MNSLRFKPQVNSLSDYYTVEELKDRGWIETIIRDHLGKPDKERPNVGSSLTTDIPHRAGTSINVSQLLFSENDNKQTVGTFMSFDFSQIAQTFTSLLSVKWL